MLTYFSFFFSLLISLSLFRILLTWLFSFSPCLWLVHPILWPRGEKVSFIHSSRERERMSWRERESTLLLPLFLSSFPPPSIMCSLLTFISANSPCASTKNVKKSRIHLHMKERDRNKYNWQCCCSCLLLLVVHSRCYWVSFLLVHSLQVKLHTNKMVRCILHSLCIAWKSEVHCNTK